MPIVPGKKAPLLQSTVARWLLLETVACGISGSGAQVVVDACVQDPPLKVPLAKQTWVPERV